MSSDTSSSISGLSSTLLFIAFFTLKVTGHIDWSWWWVTAPLWGSLALVAIGFLGAWAYYSHIEKTRRKRHDT